MKNRLCWLFLIAAALAANGEAKIRFGYRFEKGKTYTYASESETRINQEMMGRTMLMTIRNDMVFTLDPAETLGNGDIVCTARFDTLLIHFSGMNIDSTFNLSAYADKRARLVLAPHGKVKSVTPVDSFPPQSPMMQMMGVDPDALFRRLLLNLPQAELGDNEAWVNTLPDTTKISGLEMIAVPALKYITSGRETISGFDCAKVVYAGTMGIAGKGSRMGADLVVEGEGKMEGVLHYADPIGLLISGEIRSEQQLSTVVTGGTNMTIIQNTNTVIKVVYKP